MENTFINNLQLASSMTTTTNGATTYMTTNSSVYDMFALGGAMRNNSDTEIVQMFENALIEDTNLALKCLFYLRDVRGGMGERRFFRICMKHFIKSTILHGVSNFKTKVHLLKLCSEFGRWDDLIDITFGTGYWGETLNIIKAQLKKDLETEHPSLLAKWLPSENASSSKTKMAAKEIRQDLGFTAKQYRKMLSYLRNKIKVTERLMADNRWDEIEFNKIPSKAGIKYANAFRTRDETSKRYLEFISNKDSKVNAKALYPYDIYRLWSSHSKTNIVNKYWNNLPNYIGDCDKKIMCVVDTSGSMTWNGGLPQAVANSIGIYCAEKLNGFFHNKIITFSARPRFIDFSDTMTASEKFQKLDRLCINENTNIKATFDLLLKVAKNPSTKHDDIPTTLLIISDMQIDNGYSTLDSNLLTADMERIREEWNAAGIQMPFLVYWNVNAKKQTILERAKDGVTFVSGYSPIIMKQILSGKSGRQIMLDTLNQERYKEIEVIK